MHYFYIAWLQGCRMQFKYNLTECLVLKVSRYKSTKINTFLILLLLKKKQ